MGENANLEKATFGAGCFWHVEEEFRRVPGVVSTLAGYMGGWKEHPTYEEVCSKATGHAEVVEVTFDPAAVTYDHLLRVFWDCHDPTQLNRQGPDIGTNYRSVIFYHSPDQERAARGPGARAALRAPFPPHCHRDRSGCHLLVGRGIPPALPGKAGQRQLPLVGRGPAGPPRARSGSSRPRANDPAHAHYPHPTRIP